MYYDRIFIFITDVALNKLTTAWIFFAKYDRTTSLKCGHFLVLGESVYKYQPQWSNQDLVYVERLISVHKMHQVPRRWASGFGSGLWFSPRIHWVLWAGQCSLGPSSLFIQWRGWMIILRVPSVPHRWWLSDCQIKAQKGVSIHFPC